jgi:excisionase family DNA binding protein
MANVLQPLLTPAEAARVYRVHVNTIRRWVDHGEIEAVTIGEGRRRTLRVVAPSAGNGHDVAAADADAATARTTRAGASEAA